MKTKIIKTISVLAAFSTLVSCNHNSPAPAQPVPVTPPPTTPTNTNTPEGTAASLVGHWYLDSSILYISPTNHTTTKYGFNATFLNSGSTVTHYEVNITNVVTYTQTAQVAATQSNIRKTENINWFRNVSNDTTYYNSTPGSGIVSIVSDNLFVSATGYMNNYLRSFNGNIVVIADNLSTTKSGTYWYWHRQ